MKLRQHRVKSIQAQAVNELVLCLHGDIQYLGWASNARTHTHMHGHTHAHIHTQHVAPRLGQLTWTAFSIKRLRCSTFPTWQAQPATLCSPLALNSANVSSTLPCFLSMHIKGGELPCVQCGAHSPSVKIFWTARVAEAGMNTFIRSLP